MIDNWTISLASSIVVVVTATLFIGLTLSYKDSVIGRIWAASFLTGIFTTLSYLMWSLNPAAWWAVAVGNMALVGGAGLFWIGCRLHNGRRGYAWTVVLASIAALAAVLVEGKQGGPWAGVIFYFAGVSVFSGLAAFEAGRGQLNRALGGRMLMMVFAAQSLFYLARLIAFVCGGPGSAQFEIFFGTSATALVTMVLVILLSTSMALIRALQAGSVPRERRVTASAGSIIGYNDDGVLTEVAFERVLRDWLERADFHHEQLALLHFKLDDLDEINTAFGRVHGDAVLARFTAIVRRFGPPHSDIGIAGMGRLVLATAMPSIDEAIDAARQVQSALLEEPLASFAGVRPTLSVGIALTDYTGFDFVSLASAARLACTRATDAGGNRVTLDANVY